MSENENAYTASSNHNALPDGMLEVRHIKKEYKTKNGAVTKALDDVSLNFPENGMVFILGKSGSGKSTLLNVCGGLDRMDSGEIIIKGKSSKDFSTQDFDSYRNTYVGFVFQEYNILNEFTVEQNIALALELQNKKPTKAVIGKILADVDLTNFASRRPNTLSGGQKQRVAIARALVKEPEIIMADEPTGALDSKTGQQVFDTLKKLSENKLVIVISHDRDFAEQYGDRIIELKDGKIISDQTRATEGEGAKNVRFYGTDTVTVSNGAEITDAELESIRDFLSKSGGSAVISTSREKIAKFKEDRPEISVGTFENIKEQPALKQYAPQKLIRSHLPVKHAVKMGAGSLKTKPVRLMFTIFLSVIAFVLFGLASTLMLFDEHSVRVQTYRDAHIDYIAIGKEYQITDTYDGYSYSYFNDTKMTNEDYQSLAEKYEKSIPAVCREIQISNLNLSSNAAQFYSQYINTVIPASPVLTLIAGRMPEANDEIAVTDFLYDAFKSKESKFTYTKNGQKVALTINSPQDILYSAQNPVTVRNNDDEYKIVGVFKGNTVASDYQSLKEKADNNEYLENMGFGEYLWYEESRIGMYSTIAVTPSLFAELKNLSGGSVSASKYFRYSDNAPYLAFDKDDYVNFYYLAAYDGNKLPVYGLGGNLITNVGNGEIALSYNLVASYFCRRFNAFQSELENDEEYQNTLYAKLQELQETYESEHAYPQESDFEDIDGNVDYDAYNAAIEIWNENCDEYVSDTIVSFRRDYAYLQLVKQYETAAETAYRAKNPEPTNGQSSEHNAWENGLYDALYNANPIRQLDNISRDYDGNYTLSDFQAVFADVVYLFDELGLELGLTIYDDTTSETSVALVGYYERTDSDTMYLGADLYENFFRADNDYYQSDTKYEEPQDAYIDYVYVPYDGSTSRINSILDLHGKLNNDDSALCIKNTVNQQLDTVINMASVLEISFIIAGAVFALFAFLLMFNFISASITAKKKDIGILRAIGARTTDVFKIFVSEAFIIAAICFVISTAASFGLCVLLNSIIMNDVGLSVSLFAFGPLSVLCILGIALVTALVSTIIPVAIYSRKPPIASIRAL